MKLKLFIFPLFFDAFLSFCQTNFNDSLTRVLHEMQISVNKYNPTIYGYRVQIYFNSGSNSKKNATAVKTDFVSKYPDIPSTILYQPPNFKVRVGNYRDKLEAFKTLKRIRKDFPSSFIVKDQIEYIP
jgi:hypothetical protein